MKEIVEPVPMRLIQLLAFVVTVLILSQCHRIGRGRRVNLVEAAPATGPPICGHWTNRNARPDPADQLHAAGLFREQDGATGILHHGSFVTLRVPIRGGGTRRPVNSDAMTVRLV